MTTRKSRPKKTRTAQEAVYFAAHEAIKVGKILKRFNKVLLAHYNRSLVAQRGGKPFNDAMSINMSGHDLSCVVGALRDYITSRIANLVDRAPSALSLKDIRGANLSAIAMIPEIKGILSARHNWVGHINKEYIGPVKPEILYSEKIITFLNEVKYLTAIEPPTAPRGTPFR